MQQLSYLVLWGRVKFINFYRFEQTLESLPEVSQVHPQVLVVLEFEVILQKRDDIVEALSNFNYGFGQLSRQDILFQLVRPFSIRLQVPILLLMRFEPQSQNREMMPHVVPDSLFPEWPFKPILLLQR